MTGRRTIMARRTALVWAVLVLLVGAACANEPEEPEGTTQAPSPTETGTEPTTEPPVAEPYEFLARARAGEFSGTEVEILTQYIEAQDPLFEGALAPFIEETGIDVTHEGLSDYTTVLTARVEGGNAPDVAQIAQPGLMQSFAASGDLVNLSEWFNVDQLVQDYGDTYLDLGSFEGSLYGVFYQAFTKSVVWYPVQAFEDNGYQIPTSWDELMTLSDRIIADGNGNPWCLSTEQDAFTGWVITDWIEDVLLRTAPLDVYDQWVAHEIPFDHPEVLEAADYVSQVLFTPDYVYGGTTGINSIWVGDTQTPMFAEGGPQCWMHKQATWITDFWPGAPEGDPQFEAGVDSAFFYFPPIEEEFGSPVLGAGDQFVMFEDRPEVRALLEYLATPEAAQGWIEAGGFVSPNSSVPLDWYTNYKDSASAQIITQATALRFDASDSMPADVGGGTFLAGMIDWVAAEGGNTEDVFSTIDASWPSG
jgi:alpha-glucoside transport system substrate-binding protein